MNGERLHHAQSVAWLLVLATLIAAGCSSRPAALPAFSVDVSLVTETIDQVFAAYNAQYQVKPRPAEHLIDAAEAYLRRYQPGPLPRIFQTTTIYDRNGTLLAELYDEGHRTWVSLDQISQHLRDAIIATEDATFYSNPGFDARRVLGAIAQNTEAGDVVSGASTITMQLARQLFFTPEQRVQQTFERKAFETLLAQDLTDIFTKDEILEMYLNLVHFGRTIYGIEAASRLYFGKPARDLTLAEATLLAGIPQLPGEYDPITNMEAVRRRQRIVLDLMVRHGYLTADEADRVYGEVPVVQPPPSAPPVLAPHFVQYVVDDVGRRLGGMDARRSGLRIVTTLDLRMQNLAQGIVSEQVAQLRPRYDLSNAALVALRPGTAEILAMVGSAGFDNADIDGQVNVAVSLRQPGSAIKPVLYATAINDSLISPATVLWDIAVTYELQGRQPYRPVNYDRSFHGPVTARTALANSYNVPAVKLLDAVGVERMLESAQAMGINSLTRGTDWYGLSLTLGGGEVTLLDLTTAYHTIANGGLMLSPRSILVASGHVPGIAGLQLLNARTRGKPVISSDAAYLVTDILSDNVARRPAFGENSLLRLSRPAAAKTGTTTDYRDNWTVGYTRYLVAGVWAGNSDGRPMRNVTGVTGAAPIWNTFMEAVLADEAMLDLLDAPASEEGWAFVPPGDVVRMPIRCPSGLTCPEEELFTRQWVEAMGPDAVTLDSMSANATNSVYVNRGNGNRNVGACYDERSGEFRQVDTRGEAGSPDNEVRVLLRLPQGVGREQAILAAQGTDLHAIRADEADLSPAASEQDGISDRARRIREEQQAVLDWSARNGRTLFWGDCAEVEAVARFMYGNRLAGVRISGYDNIAADGTDVEDDESGAVANAEASDRLAASPQFVAATSSRYQVLGIAHNSSCSGPRVMGQVYNAGGQPVAGITVVLDAPSGRQTATTSAGAADYGSYNFAIPDDSPQQITVMLFDSNGVQVGAGAIVGHNMGGPTDQPCHYVHWGGIE